MPKTQIVIHDSHNHTRFAKANTQDSCKHARIQNITTHNSHKKKNKKKTHTHTYTHTQDLHKTSNKLVIMKDNKRMNTTT